MQQKRLKTYLLITVLNHPQGLFLSVLIFKDLNGNKLSNLFQKIKIPEHVTRNSNTEVDD